MDEMNKQAEQYWPLNWMYVQVGYYNNGMKNNDDLTQLNVKSSMIIARGNINQCFSWKWYNVTSKSSRRYMTKATLITQSDTK